MSRSGSHSGKVPTADALILQSSCLQWSEKLYVRFCAGKTIYNRRKGEYRSPHPEGGIRSVSQQGTGRRGESTGALAERLCYRRIRSAGQEKEFRSGGLVFQTCGGDPSMDRFSDRFGDRDCFFAAVSTKRWWRLSPTVYSYVKRGLLPSNGWRIKVDNMVG